MKTIGLISNNKSKKLFLLPDAVAALTSKGIKVNVMSGYGKSFNIADAQYVTAGANVLPNAKHVIANSDVICKADVFSKDEISSMNGKIAVTMANYLANVDMLYFMLKSNVTGIAWNNLASANGYVFYPTIEKAKGEYAVRTIADAMHKGLAKKKENISYPHPAKMLILNAGYASVAATKLALANGFDVMLLDHDKEYLKQLLNDEEIKATTAKLKTKFSVGPANFENLQKQIAKSNAFINTCIDPENRTKLRITKEMANSMPAGSILYDAGSENGYAFAWIKKIVKPEFEYVRFNKIFYVSVDDNRDLIAKQFTDVVSTNSVQPLIDLCNEGQSNKYIARTVICNKGKVVDANVKTVLTLY